MPIAALLVSSKVCRMFLFPWSDCSAHNSTVFFPFVIVVLRRNIWLTTSYNYTIKYILIICSLLLTSYLKCFGWEFGWLAHFVIVAIEIVMPFQQRIVNLRVALTRDTIHGRRHKVHDKGRWGELNQLLKLTSEFCISQFVNNVTD